MTSKQVREELLLSDVAEFFAEEVTELSKIPSKDMTGDHLPTDIPQDLSNWEVQVFEFEETKRKHLVT